jgi:4-hydroxy-4-methyl-2-oxoglutarate aldolase
MNAIEIGALPVPLDMRMLSRLSEAEPATIGHFREQGFMHRGIKPVTNVARTVGTAITVRCEGLDGAILHYALGQLRPGDFLIIDRAGDDSIACIGGASALAAALSGAVGIIVDGCVTDIAELREIGISIWARGLSARTTRSEGLRGGFCTPVQCGGVMVYPGDAVLADENGILILPPADVQETVSQAVSMQEQEKLSLARLRKGETYPEVLGTVFKTQPRTPS